MLTVLYNLTLKNETWYSEFWLARSPMKFQWVTINWCNTLKRKQFALHLWQLIYCKSSRDIHNKQVFMSVYKHLQHNSLFLTLAVGLHDTVNQLHWARDDLPKSLQSITFATHWVCFNNDIMDTVATLRQEEVVTSSLLNSYIHI